MYHCFHKVFVWIENFDLFKAFILEIDLKRVEHEFGQLEPRVVHFDQVCFLPHLAVLDPKFFPIALDLPSHVPKCLVGQTIVCAIGFISEQRQYCCFSFFIFLLQFEFPPQEFNDVVTFNVGRGWGGVEFGTYLIIYLGHLVLDLVSACFGGVQTLLEHSQSLG